MQVEIATLLHLPPVFRPGYAEGNAPDIPDCQITHDSISELIDRLQKNGNTVINAQSILHDVENWQSNASESRDKNTPGRIIILPALLFSDSPNLRDQAVEIIQKLLYATRVFWRLRACLCNDTKIDDDLDEAPFFLMLDMLPEEDRDSCNYLFDRLKYGDKHPAVNAKNPERWLDALIDRLHDPKGFGLSGDDLNKSLPTPKIKLVSACSDEKERDTYCKDQEFEGEIRNLLEYSLYKVDFGNKTMPTTAQILSSLGLYNEPKLVPLHCAKSSLLENVSEHVDSLMVPKDPSRADKDLFFLVKGFKLPSADETQSSDLPSLQIAKDNIDARLKKLTNELEKKKLDLRYTLSFIPEGPITLPDEQQSYTVFLFLVLRRSAAPDNASYLGIKSEEAKR